MIQENYEKILTFSDKLTLPNANKILIDAINMMKCESNIIGIDCSQATEIDLSFIQILIAVRCAATARGKKVTLSPPVTGILSDALERGGFAADAWWTGGSAVA